MAGRLKDSVRVQPSTQPRNGSPVRTRFWLGHLNILIMGAFTAVILLTDAVDEDTKGNLVYMLAGYLAANSQKVTDFFFPQND